MPLGMDWSPPRDGMAPAHQLPPIHHARQAIASAQALIAASPLIAPTIGKAVEGLEDALATLEELEASDQRRSEAAALGITSEDLQ